MSQEEIIKYKRLIAKFMEWEDSPYEHLPNRMYKTTLEISKHLNSFRYDSEWEELMPVVEKISKLHSIEGLFKEYSKVTEALLLIDITALFKAVGEFIEWYNKTKSV